MNSLPPILEIAVIGGGASGFFTALQCAELAPDRSIAILKKAHISCKGEDLWRGRCNVTHACFEPKELAKNYPRGSRELLAAFLVGNRPIRSTGSRASV
ncbi:MAG: hypothetical protein HC845_13975 [Akkermansiaceae bacterium]|nr:hypothetical protein [Akkermansiaceae bacterium]